MPTPFRARAIACALHAAILLGPVLSLPVAAAEAAEVRAFDIPAGPLDAALGQFARQAGVSVGFSAEQLQGRSTAGVQGEHRVEAALAALLSGTGLLARAGSEGYVLETAPTPGAVQLPAVQVRADRDQGLSTEGSRAYAARGVSLGKTPATLRETPQSVTVLTRQRMEDQNFVELTEAVKYVPGVVVRRQSSTGNRSDIYARGYTANTYQLDGLNTASNPATLESLDLALFDRVEVLRGPACLFSGAGEPGVTINLARKRARAPFAVQGLVGGGSWDRYRAEADVTGALSGSGRLRGRAVAIGEDFGSYLRGVDGDKQVAYGTLEFDLSPATTLSVGATWQRSQGYYDTGLPAYADGRLPDLPRSTAIIADWSTAEPESLDGFVELERRQENGGLLKLAVRKQDRRQRDQYINAYSAINANGESTFTQAQRVARDYDDTTVDLFFSMPFDWAGRRHNLLVGADYRASDLDTSLDVGTMNTTVNLWNYVPSAIPEPAFVPNWRNLGETESYGVYTQLRFKPADALTLVAGGRLSWWEATAFNRMTQVSSGYDADAEFTPYGALILDVGQALSLYASYAEIFQPQNNLTVGGDQIEPRTGGQVEAGIKGEFLDGGLNAALAVFRISDQNRSLADPNNTGFFIPAGKVRSEGVEAELTGRLAPRWNLSAGYAYVRTEYLRGTAAQTGQSFSTFSPRHNFNLWTHYQLPEAWLKGAEVGAGLRAVSDFYTQAGAVRWEAGGYTTVSLQAGYQLNPHYKLALNVENLPDRHYWERVENGTRSNYYGAPRSLMLTVRGSW